LGSWGKDPGHTPHTHPNGESNTKKGVFKRGKSHWIKQRVLMWKAAVKRKKLRCDKGERETGWGGAEGQLQSPRNQTGKSVKKSGCSEGPKKNVEKQILETGFPEKPSTKKRAQEHQILKRYFQRKMKRLHTDDLTKKIQQLLSQGLTPKIEQANKPWGKKRDQRKSNSCPAPSGKQFVRGQIVA